MKNRSFLFHLAVLVAAMMCALGASASEAYACYTPSNTTLTFYYDNQRSSRQGTIYNLNTDDNPPGWIYDDTNEDVTRVVFDPSFADVHPTTTCYWFHDMRNLQTIVGMKEYLNTSEVTDMAFMFGYCSNLTSLDLSRFDTSKVTNMSSMFSNCSGLTSLDLRGFDTRKVTNMSSMFSFCSGLKSVNLLSFNTSQVADMKYMFMGNQNLRTIYAGYAWSTAAVTSSSMMFFNCTSLVGGQGTTYDYIHYNKDYAHLDGGPSDPGYFTLAGTEAYACYTSWNTTLTFYFDGQRDSRPGTTYDLNEDDTGPGWEADGTNELVTQVVFDSSFANSRPTTTFSWFFYMRNLESITGMEYLNTSQVTNMGYMFSYCFKLTSLDLSTFNTSKVTNMRSMFNQSWQLRSLDLSSFNTSKVTNMMYMFGGCTHLITAYVGSGWSTAAVQFSTSMFQYCRSLVGGQGTTYDENHVDAAYAHLDGGPSNPGYFTAVGTEAYACYTSENTTLTFYYDTERSSRTGTTYDLNTDENSAGWHTDGIYRNVTKVVFDPSFAIARPLTTFGWFYGMTNLETITGMNYLNTSQVTDMLFMFRGCSLLTSLDLSHFNTSNVTNMESMFYGCSSLTSLDLSRFITPYVTNMSYMFKDCGNLQTIYAGNGWVTVYVTSSTSMFENCNRLVGGQGTTYDFNYIDKAYAHIDGGPSNPGYFTAPIEPYACYTPSNTTLTFYYDTQRSSRPGTTYALNTGTTDTGWGTDGTNANVTKVDFDPSFAGARPTTTYSWFYGMRNLQTITGIEYLNTSEVTDMAHMFNACSSLISLDVSGFNTSKVSSMESMFFGCSSLRTVYAGDGWTTTAVTSSTNMFKNCTSLVGGQGTTFDANHVDAAYAHIDGGPSNPGYFTDKNASLRGDVNGDGSVNIADVTALIDLLLGGGTISNPAADCNQDGTVNISDVTALIDFLLSGSW